MNPFEFLQMLKGGGSPQNIVMNMLQSQMGGTPMGDNLMQLAQNGDTKGIEQIARNICKQQGRDFDKEFQNFKQQYGLK